MWLQPSFVLVFEGDSEWKSAVSFNPADDAHVVLVDQQGNILWKTDGPVNQEHMRELQDALGAD
jgi:predicted transcriptional regulator